MAVQEFLIDEVKNITERSEDLLQWSQYVERLGLEGQRQLTTTTDRSPIPFPLMNKTMTRVYEQLCPSKMLVKDYNKTAIPLRVLALIALCTEKEYFGKIEIWYDEQSPDPVVVGCDGQDKYLIARWADELEEFAVLLQKAIQRRIKIRTEKLRKKMLETETELKTVEQDVSLYMMGEISYLYD